MEITSSSMYISHMYVSISPELMIAIDYKQVNITLMQKQETLYDLHIH